MVNLPNEKDPSLANDNSQTTTMTTTTTTMYKKHTLHSLNLTYDNTVLEYIENCTVHRHVPCYTDLLEKRAYHLLVLFRDS